MAGLLHLDDVGRTVRAGVNGMPAPFRTFRLPSAQIEVYAEKLDIRPLLRLHAADMPAGRRP